MILKQAIILTTFLTAATVAGYNSHSFFLTGLGNKATEENILGLVDPAQTGQNYCPSSEISDGKGGYVGAFRNASDNWMSGWTNFDPQHTVY